MMIVLRLVYGSYEWQICTQLLRFLMVIYMFLCLMMMIQQNWTKSIIIFIIELGIWVVMAWRPPQYRRGKRTSCTGLMSDHCVVHVVSLRFALPQYTLNPDSSLIIVWRCNGWPYFGDKRFFRCAIISINIDGSTSTLLCFKDCLILLLISSIISINSINNCQHC